jgi:hypothetical protein
VLLLGKAEDGDGEEDKGADDGNIFQPFSPERAIDEKGNSSEFQNSKPGIMDIVGYLEVDEVKKNGFGQPRGTAIKKYYPQTFTPVPFQKQEIKSYG